MKQIHLIHGLAEKKGGNISGMADLQEKIALDNPGSLVQDYEQNVFDSIVLNDWDGKIILVGRSWGAAAAFRYIDTHPNTIFDLVVAFDPVTNFFKAPRTWPCIGWKRRSNLKFFLSLSESESFLKGHRVADKVTPFVADEKGVLVRETSWYREVVLPNDPKTKTKLEEFLSHFSISKNEFIVNQARERIKAV